MKIELDLPVPEGWRFVGFKVPKKGQAMIASNGDFIETFCDWSCVNHLTFERIEPVDEELELARKKFPVGSYYKSGEHGDTLFKVREVIRDPASIYGVIIYADCENAINAIIEDWVFVAEYCTPFPLPVWRCCDADKPKRIGSYFLKRKDKTEKLVTSIYDSGTWAIGFESASNYEWLDEGGAE